MASISERIFEIADKKYLDQSKFAAAVGVTQSVVSAWKNGKSESYMKRLPQIADLLGTSVDYLMTGEQKKSAPTNGDGLSPAKRALWEAVDGLSEEQCEKLLGIIQEAKKLF